MEEINENKCACPHECANVDCFICKAEYDFIVEEPNALKCGHKVCKLCETRILGTQLKCAVCALTDEENIMVKDDVIHPVIRRHFDKFIKNSLETCFANLKEKMNNMHGNMILIQEQNIKKRKILF